MMSRRLRELEATAARLEAAAERFERLGLPEAIPLEAVTVIAHAAAASVAQIFGAVHDAIAAGERDRLKLLAIAYGPLGRVLAALPPAQAASGANSALGAVLGRLIDLQTPPVEPSAPTNSQSAGVGSRS
jgi:hypothetical protein